VRRGALLLARIRFLAISRRPGTALREPVMAPRQRCLHARELNGQAHAVKPKIHAACSEIPHQRRRAYPVRDATTPHAV
jgi:hypothetical protein